MLAAAVWVARLVISLAAAVVAQAQLVAQVVVVRMEGPVLLTLEQLMLEVVVVAVMVVRLDKQMAVQVVAEQVQ